jgi:16S rRNA (uracil1498-N3)-methyltransferase
MITLLAAPGTLVSGASVLLSDEESHHLRVRRGEAAERVRVTDGEGMMAIATVGRQGRAVAASIEAVERVPRPAPLVVAVGAGDRDRFGLMIEKATELGATAIVPLETERTRTVATRLRESGVAKLRRRALEAVKQCGSAWAPVIAEPVDLAAFLATAGPGVRWLADADGAAPGSLDPAEPVTMVVGPEGGFAGRERALLLRGGFIPVRLGCNVLRFETAVAAGLSVVWLARQRGSHG